MSNRCILRMVAARLTGLAAGVLYPAAMPLSVGARYEIMVRPGAVPKNARTTYLSRTNYVSARPWRQNHTLDADNTYATGHRAVSKILSKAQMRAESTAIIGFSQLNCFFGGALRVQPGTAARVPKSKARDADSTSDKQRFV